MDVCRKRCFGIVKNHQLTIVLLLMANRPLVSISSKVENDLALPCMYVIESSSPPVCCVEVDHQTTEFLLP